MVFHAEENIILHQHFESKEDRISHLRKIQNSNYSVFRKQGNPCWRKYHLTSTFWIKIRPYFPSSKKSKQELFPYSENMVFHAKENIIWHQVFESNEDHIFHFQKVQNKNFPIIWTFLFMQNSCFCNNFFFSFIEIYVSFNHFKDLVNLHYKMKYEDKFRNFFSLNFQWLQHDVWEFWWHRRSLKTESGTSNFQKPKQRR